MGPLETNPDLWNSGVLYTAVGGPHHCDGDPTLDIYACPEVVFTPLGGEVSGQTFQHVLCLIYNQTTHIYDIIGSYKIKNIYIYSANEAYKI